MNNWGQHEKMDKDFIAQFNYSRGCSKLGLRSELFLENNKKKFFLLKKKQNSFIYQEVNRAYKEN